MSTITAPSGRDKVAAVHDQLIAQMDQLITSQDWEQFLRLAARFHHYSSNNCLLILAQRPVATVVASFTAWRAMGRSIRKGERGISILAPCRSRVEGTEHASAADASSWVLKGFRVVHVFDISQTEGEPLERHDVAVLLEGAAPAGMWDAVATLVERDGYSLRRRDCGEANGCTDRTAATVIVAPQLSEAAAAKTLVHELAHVRQTDDHLRTISRALGEVEAESVAFIVCHAFGLASAPYSIGYVAGWAAGDLDVVKRTAAWSVATAHRIIEQAYELLATPTPAQ
jgi:hypothetical protein